ncbi:MAG: radical SAM protein [Endomicrobiia bacterium]
MFTEVKVKNIINKHKNNSLFKEYTVNPYYGCIFDCVYCYVRGSKYGQGEEKGLRAKINAIEILEKELQTLSKKNDVVSLPFYPPIFSSYKETIIISSSTDPYLPLEKELKLTRRMLETIKKYNFPVEIITKSDLVLRDIDLLKEFYSSMKSGFNSRANFFPLKVSISISTLDEKLSSLLEPNAPPPTKRLEVVKILKDEGILSGIYLMPVIPFITDSEKQIELVIKTAKDYGAEYVIPSSLSLYETFDGNRNSCKFIFYKFLETHFPSLISKYDNLYNTGSFTNKEYHENLYKKIKKISQKYRIKNTSFL